MKTYAIVTDDGNIVIAKYRDIYTLHGAEGVYSARNNRRVVEIESPDSIHLPSDEFIKSYIRNNKK